MIGCFVVIPAVIILLSCFSSLHATEWGLDYDGILMKVNPQPYSAGLHFLGVKHSFIRFPNTYQNLQYSTAEHDLLHTRTSDGLPLTLGLSFQYTLQQDKLYELYLGYKMQHNTVLFNVASDIIANTASNYSAYNFFNDKQSIALSLQQQLNQYIRPHLYMNVETLQITVVELPQSFEDAIVESISVKQNITRMRKEKEFKLVTFSTMLMAAKQSANQTVTEARGKAQQILAEQNAAAAVVTQNLGTEARAYKVVQDSLNLGVDDLLEYVWWDSLTEQHGDSEFLVGVNPAAYITTA